MSRSQSIREIRTALQNAETWLRAGMVLYAKLQLEPEFGWDVSFKAEIDRLDALVSEAEAAENPVRPSLSADDLDEPDDAA